MISTILQVIVVFGAIAIGSRYAGIGLGIWGGVGLCILVTVFGLRPTSAPVDVLLIMIAVATAASVMDAAGGVDYMVRIAEKNHPCSSEPHRLCGSSRHLVLRLPGRYGQYRPIPDASDLRSVARRRHSP